MLAKEGYYSGDPEKIMQAKCTWVQKLYAFEQFTKKLDNETYLLNNK